LHAPRRRERVRPCIYAGKRARFRSYSHPFPHFLAFRRAFFLASAFDLACARPSTLAMSTPPYAPQPRAPHPAPSNPDAFPSTAAFYPPPEQTYPLSHPTRVPASEPYALADSNPPFRPANAPHDAADAPYDPAYARYDPANGPYDPANARYDFAANAPYDPYKPPGVDARFSARTPSPTPSEHEFLAKRGVTSVDFKNFKKYFARKYISAWRRVRSAGRH
jgi:hypothetical protein